MVKIKAQFWFTLFSTIDHYMSKNWPVAFIYILGTIFTDHDYWLNVLFRALYGRIEQFLQGLPPPFLLNRPLMLPVTSKEVRQPQKAPNFSVIWKKNMQQPEIINCSSGKTEEGGISSIAKQALAHRFLTFCGKLPTITDLKGVPPTYIAAKEYVENYKVGFWVKFVIIFLLK